jgi:acyl-CoA thioester hydrolase
MANPEFIWPIRVYYEDTDAGGVVFYANYLKFFERARTEWLRAAGIGQDALAKEHGVLFVVKSATVDYHAPAKLDDELKLSTVVERLGRASVQFVQSAWRQVDNDRILLASARVKVGCIGNSDLRPASIPAKVFEQLQRRI